MPHTVKAVMTVACATLALVLTAAGPAAAARPATQGAGGCTDTGVIQVCVLENPEPAIVGSASLDHNLPNTTCSVTISVYSPDTGANRVSAGPFDCTVSTPWVSEHAIVGQTYVACVQGTVNFQPVSGCSPYQLAHS